MGGQGKKASITHLLFGVAAAYLLANAIQYLFLPSVSIWILWAFSCVGISFFQNSFRAEDKTKRKHSSSSPDKSEARPARRSFASVVFAKWGDYGQ